MAGIENKLIMSAFEKDGEIYSPIYEECSICSFVLSKLVGFDFSGEQVSTICVPRQIYVEEDSSCAGFDLNYSALSEEHQDEYDRLDEAGELNDPDGLTEKEFEDFLNI
jgi:hypothetical protein